MTKPFTLILGGFGALVGALVSTTKKGKEVDDVLSTAFDFFEQKIAKYIFGEKEFTKK